MAAHGRLLACALAAGLAPAVPGCSGAAGTGEPGHGVLVITIDALRPDHLQLEGYDRETSPTLSALAAQGVYLESAWAAAPEVVQSHASILTGCDPRIARRPAAPGTPVDTLMAAWFIPKLAPRLARELLAAGYSTAAYVDHPHISSLYGFAEGFERFKRFRGFGGGHDVEGVAQPFLRWLGHLDRGQDWFAYVTVNELERVWLRDDPASDTYFAARQELDELPPVGDADQIFFAIPRGRWRGGSYSLGEYEAKYDGALRKLDRKLMDLFQRLRELGRWESTTICVVGSYGVSFGESGMILDTGTLDEVDLRVPVIIKPAAGAAFEPGGRIGHVFSLCDLAPTLLEIAGLPVPEAMHGVSHSAALRGTGPPARKLAFAAGGLQRGMCVIGPQYTYELIEPDSLGPSRLAASWFGDSTGHAGGERELLFDRAAGREDRFARPPLDAGQRVVADRMRAAGEEWGEWIEHARVALHPVPWEREPLSADVRAGLLQRGLVPTEVLPR